MCEIRVYCLSPENGSVPPFKVDIALLLSPNAVNPYFHFATLPPNLWIVAIINIHAGVNAMKTLWRSVPNG